ncbi:hypothetical protein AYK26_02520 [Euryarchaeota archaeon SM23-78]|nr:MAG: hypothetical protein AYK26_02520 [Euryarchaeota archaeon SM23-78]
MQMMAVSLFICGIIPLSFSPVRYAHSQKPSKTWFLWVQKCFAFLRPGKRQATPSQCSEAELLASQKPEVFAENDRSPLIKIIIFLI